MKKFRNIALIILIITAIVVVGCCAFYNYQLSPVSKSDEIVEIEIPASTSTKKIAEILKENKLIRDKRVFLIYAKIFNANNMKAGHYEISYDMGVKKIVEVLGKGSKKNPNEVQITFQEGINMRDIARLISKHTDNSYDSVIEKSNDLNYINSLIDNYWFITEDILNDQLYYKLEGYLFPDTYRFDNNKVSVENIFNKMLDKMASVLEPYKTDIQKSNFSIHEILTLATMSEKEVAADKERGKVVSVFVNRINSGMSLGSDVTTRYAHKIDNKKQVLTAKQYQTKNPYNTRITDGSMNGKLPIGPICSPSKGSIEAAVYPAETDAIYFIANIKTLETFYFNNSKGFEAKKAELADVNGGF